MENVAEKSPEIILDPDIDYDFFVWMKENSYALKTCADYHRYILRLLGKKKVISTDKIKSFLSVKNSLSKRSAVKLFLVFLDDMKSIKLPEFRYPRIKKVSKALDVISIDSFNKLVGVIDDDFKVFSKLMFYGGLRVSECASILTENFNWYDWLNDQKNYGELKVLKAKRNKERIIPINPSLMREIFLYAKKHDDGALKKGRLFDFRHKLYMYRKKRKGYPLEVAESKYTHKVYRLFTLRLKEASLKVLGKVIRSHTLRSSRATYLDNMGLQPSTLRDFLGHENISTTSRYIVNTPEKLRNEIRKVDG